MVQLEHEVVINSRIVQAFVVDDVVAFFALSDVGRRRRAVADIAHLFGFTFPGILLVGSRALFLAVRVLFLAFRRFSGGWGHDF